MLLRFTSFFSFLFFSFLLSFPLKLHSLRISQTHPRNIPFPFIPPNPETPLSPPSTKPIPLRTLPRLTRLVLALLPNPLPHRLRRMPRRRRILTGLATRTRHCELPSFCFHPSLPPRARGFLRLELTLLEVADGLAAPSVRFGALGSVAVDAALRKVVGAAAGAD